MTVVDWDRLAVVETWKRWAQASRFLTTLFSQQLITGSTYCLVGLLNTQHTHLPKGNLIFKATCFVFYCIYCSFWMEEMWVIITPVPCKNIWSIPIIHWPSQTWDVDSHKENNTAPLIPWCSFKRIMLHCYNRVDGLFQEVYLYLYMKYTHQDSKWQPPNKKNAVICEPWARNKTPLTFHLYWLFNRDPYNGLWNNL